jgi:hypothetical protein
MGNLFRDKAVKNVNQPEDLNDYIRVTTPAVWIVLAAVVLMLIGALAWSIFGTVDVHQDNGTTIAVHPITFVTN